MAAFVVKTPLTDSKAATFSFSAEKTMYGGKGIAAGDVIYLFDSELFAKDGALNAWEVR